jgi:surface protein
LVSTGKYNFVVEWGDGTSSLITQWDQAEVTHTYDTPGIYRIRIRGILNRLVFAGHPDRRKIIDVVNWGGLIVGSSTFDDCRNMVISATDAPNLRVTKSLQATFRDCRGLTNENFSHWDTSQVTSMRWTFWRASNFNGSVNGWNVSNVTNMQGLFQQTQFNSPLDTWDVRKVTSMGGSSDNTEGMFKSTPFNQDISMWQTDSLVLLGSTFYAATQFNQNINSWNVSKVTNMNGTFAFAYAFNQPLNNWNTSNVIGMYSTFWNATSFNQNINSWNVSKVTRMDRMFQGAIAFNQPLNNWDVSKVSLFGVGTFGNGGGMFRAATAFNQDISMWDISSATQMPAFMVGKSNYLYVGDCYDKWSKLALNSNVLLHFGTNKYPVINEPDKQKIIDDFGWTIADGGVL